MIAAVGSIRCRWRWRGTGIVAGAVLLLAVAGRGRADDAPVPMFGLVEVSLVDGTDFANPFGDAVCEAEFTAPSGRRVRVGGFYDGDRTWRVRFVPREHGNWTWTARVSGGAAPAETNGAFRCAGRQGHGFLRIARANPFRYEYEDGTSFYPIGIQTCDFLQPDFDGPAAENSPPRFVSNAEWLAAFTGAVNLVRTQFGQGTKAGCALPLIAVPNEGAPGVWAADRYDLDLARRIDDVYREQRAAGISQILILFQDMSLWGNGATAFGHARDLQGYKNRDAENLALQEQYMRYVVARYGAFVDIWELFNEDSYAPADYLAHLAGVIRAADPYGHLLTTNYGRPGADWCDLTTWHEYMAMPAREVDAYVVSQIALFKSRGKLVQNTEFGNQGALSNVDPVKWRIAVWAAHLHESSLVFWSMSQRQFPAGHLTNGNANAYIGPDTRRAFRVFHDVTAGLPVDMRPVAVGYVDQRQVRAYALAGDGRALVYVHQVADHMTAITLADPLLVQTGPGRWRARWVAPESGDELASEDVETGQQYLSLRVPPVTVDAVARLERIDRVTLDGRALNSGGATE
jgi:hypothetical protein